MRIGHFDDSIDKQKLETPSTDNNLDKNEENNFNINDKLKNKDNFQNRNIDNPKYDDAKEKCQDKLKEATHPNKYDINRDGIKKEPLSLEKNIDKQIEKDKKDYINNLKDKVKYPETIPLNALDDANLRKASPEEIKGKRNDFRNKKKNLIKEWEENNGKKWPTYTEDIYNGKEGADRKPIRFAGEKYDAHHIRPLELGGDNTSANITPVHCKNHIKGSNGNEIHSSNGPYERLVHDVEKKDGK